VIAFVGRRDEIDGRVVFTNDSGVIGRRDRMVGVGVGVNAIRVGIARSVGVMSCGAAWRGARKRRNRGAIRGISDYQLCVVVLV
jgi:hypothetical protein